MISYKPFLLLVLPLLLQCRASKQDDPSPPAQEAELPPITQQGNATMGCLVDGQAWLPAKTATGFDVFGYYRLQTLSVTGINQQGRQTHGLSLVLAKVTKPGTYPLGQAQQGGTFCIYSTPDDQFFSSRQNPGKVIIARLDTVNGIVAGEFEAEVVNSAGKKHQLTKGRFDIRL